MSKIIRKKKSKKKTNKKNKVKKVSKRKLIKKLDEVFSKYIRLKNANSKWIVQCYTCWIKDLRKNMQCWHFFSRKHMKTRWEEWNCEVQCYRCNVVLNGNYIIFTKKKLEEWWEELFEKRMQESKKLSDFTIQDLENKIEYYKEKVKELEKKLEMNKEDKENKKK